jgi:hypothetical protein
VADDLEFSDDLGDCLEDFDKLVHQFLVLDAKLYKVAKKIFLKARELHRIADDDLETIREAAVPKQGKEKTTLDFLAADLENVMANVNDTAVDELLLRMKRELALVRRVARVLS